MQRSTRLCALFCVLLLFLTGCSSLPTSSTAPTVSIPQAGSYAEQFRDNWCYRLLNSRLQLCYGTLYTALTDSADKDDIITVQTEDEGTAEHTGIKIMLPVELSSKEEAQKLYSAFLFDNPQFFFISNAYSLEGYASSGTSRYNQINLLFTMDKNQREIAATALEQRLSDILENAPSTDDQFVTELYLHDKLVSICSYDTAAAAGGYTMSPHAFSAYGALVEGKAVCEGYSRAMQLLLKRSGISCTLVTGHSVYSGESHMWNYVTINGHNYHLDVTWDDSEDVLRHNYFNLTTDQLSLSHRADPEQADIDACVSTQDNYYVRNKTRFQTGDRELIAAAIAKQIKDGTDCIELAFTNDCFDEALLFLKNATLVKQAVDPLLVDSGLTLWDYSLRGETKEYILSLHKR